MDKLAVAHIQSEPIRFVWLIRIRATCQAKQDFEDLALGLEKQWWTFFFFPLLLSSEEKFVLSSIK